MMVKSAVVAIQAAMVLVATLASAKVFVLDDANFDQTLSQHSPMLVEFYAPWCGHCKALEPEYEAAGKTLTDKKAPVFLGKVDVTADSAKELGKRFQIQGFPTLKYFPVGAKDADVIEYDGERKAQNIVSWLEKRVGPPFVTLTSEAELNKAKATVTADNEKLVVIGVFAEKEQAHAFEQVAKKDYARDYFAVIKDAKLGSAVDSKSKAPFVQVLRSFNMSNPAVTADASVIGDVGKLEKFVATSSEPHSDVVTYNDADIRGTIKNGVHVVEFYAPWCGYCKQFAPEYDKVAAHYVSKKSNVVIAKFDGTSNDDVTAEQGIEGFPTVKIFRDGASATFKGDLSSAAVIQFIEEKVNAKAESLASEAAVATFVKSAKNAIVGCVSEANEAVIDALAFQAASESTKVGKQRCSAGAETLAVYVDGAKKSTYPAGSSFSDSAAVARWYKRALFKPVFRFDDNAFEELTAAEYKYVIFYFNTNADAEDAEVKLFEELAASNAFEDTCYTYATGADDYLLQYFGIKPDSLPAVRILVAQGDLTSYVGPHPLSKEALKEAFAQLEAGTLEKVVQGSGEEEAPEVGDDYKADESEEAEGDEAEEGDDGADADAEEEEEDAPSDEL